MASLRARYLECITPPLHCYRTVRDLFASSFVPTLTLYLISGSVFVGGSNPNSDYNAGSGIKYPTEYRVERFYPSYYNQRRPQPQGLLAQLSYGGPSFDVTLSSDDLLGDAKNIQNASVVIIRTGFSTHAMVRSSLKLAPEYKLMMIDARRIWANDTCSWILLTPVS